MSNQHTPGPWTVNQVCDKENPDSEGIFVASLAPISPNCDQSPKIGTLAQCYAVGDTRDVATVRANACLIAAAPDMLDALRRADKAISFAMDSVPASTSARCQLLIDRDRVRLVISKAEGQA